MYYVSCYKLTDNGTLIISSQDAMIKWSWYVVTFVLVTYICSIYNSFIIWCNLCSIKSNSYTSLACRRLLWIQFMRFNSQFLNCSCKSSWRNPAWLTTAKHFSGCLKSHSLNRFALNVIVTSFSSSSHHTSGTAAKFTCDIIDKNVSNNWHDQHKYLNKIFVSRINLQESCNRIFRHKKAFDAVPKCRSPKYMVMVNRGTVNRGLSVRDCLIYCSHFLPQIR